jgi:exonuclease SbcC
MALFDSMLKPGWQHPDASVRMAAVNEIDDEAVLVEVVESDQDEDLRAQALSRISNSTVLDDLLTRLDGGLLARAKAIRLSQVLPEGSSLSDIVDDEQLLLVASLADEEELRQKAVEQLSDEAVRYDVALEHPLARVRLCAAQGIHDIELLQRLCDAMQGKDKAIYRHCKDQLNKHKDVIRQEDLRQQKIELLLEKAQTLSSAIDSPEYVGSIRLLQRNWQEVSDHASQQQRDSIRLYMETCSARVADKLAAVAADHEREETVARALATTSTVLEELQQVASGAPSLDSREGVSKLGDRLDALEAKWQEAATHVRVERDKKNNYEELNKIWRQVYETSSFLQKNFRKVKKLGADLDKADKSDFVLHEQLHVRVINLSGGLSWPRACGLEKPRQFVELSDWQKQIKSRLSELSTAEPQNSQRVEEALSALDIGVTDGHMKDASRALARARRALKSLPAGRQKHFEKKLHTLVQRLDEIRDWQGFAIEPKKLALCEEMDALAESETGAEKLAKQIHELQEQWKQLGPIEPKKDQELWRRFSKAADKAYEPCKVAFARQAEERKVNLARRMDVVSELREYEKKTVWPLEDTSEFDWRAVLDRLDRARSDMRAIKPVGQKGATRSESALKKASDVVYDHIREEYDQNIERKEDLIGRAQKLSEVESLDQAIDQAKKLQVSWKGVGITPVKVDRGQWRKFRTACDAVFKRLDVEKKQQRAEIDAVVEHAEGLVKQAEDLLHASDDAARLHIRETLGELRNAFGALELPRGAEQRLGKRLGQVDNQAQKVADETRKRLRASQWHLLFDRVRACALKAQDEAGAIELWEQEGELPKGVSSSAIARYWEEGSVDGNTESLQEICIAAEVLADVDSPAGDSQARMAYQVKRLADGMGKQREAPRATLFRLLNEFIDHRPSTEWAERFCGVVRQINI